MNKWYSSDKLFEGNKAVLFCVVFTVVIIFATIANAITGVTIYLSIEYVFSNIAQIGAPIVTASALQRLWKLKYFAERDYLLWVGLVLHYLISLGLILFFTFLHGMFREIPLPQGIYLFRLRDYTLLYAIIVVGAIVVDLMRTATDNKNLRKIQSKLNEAKKPERRD